MSYFDGNAPGNHSGMLDLIDPRTGERRLRLRAPALPGPAQFVYADVAFLPTGHDLLMRPVDGTGPGGQAAPVYRVDGETGALTDRVQVGRYASNFNATETADRRRMFLTSRQDNRTWELDTQRLRVVRSWPVGDFAGAVSPDGRTFALGSDSGEIRLLDLTSGRVRPMEDKQRDAVSRMRFTPDGRTLVTSGQDGQVLAWDVDRRTIAERFTGHSRAVDGLDLAADGRTLLTASLDARAILWDLAGDRRLDRRFAVGAPFDFPFTPRGIAVSPDGRTLAVTHSDGKVDLIDARDAATMRRVPALDAPATAVAFSPDGRLLAVTGVGGLVTLWDARTLAPAGESRCRRLRRDRLLARRQDARRGRGGCPRPAAEGRAAGVWDVHRRTLTAFRGGAPPTRSRSARMGACSPPRRPNAGRRCARRAGAAFVKRLVTPRDFARSVAFSPHGDLLFVGQYDGRGHLFSTATWKPVGRPLEGTRRGSRPRSSHRTATRSSPPRPTGTVVLWE